MLVLLGRRRKRSEMLHQQAVDKDIAAADLAKEDALCAIIEERDEVQRQSAAAVEKKAQDGVLNES